MVTIEAHTSGGIDPDWVENPGPWFSFPRLKLEHKSVRLKS